MNEYKLVPVKPTPEMVSKGARLLQIMSLPEREAASVFRAMLAAAPDHIAGSRKMVSDQLRGGTKKIGRPQIREVFLRNGFTIKPGCDDLRDYVYKAAFELLELAAPAVQVEPAGAEQQPGVTLLLELLSHARCSTCDGSGGFYDNHGDPHQCQWCHDRSTALAAYRNQGGES